MSNLYRKISYVNAFEFTDEKSIPKEFPMIINHNWGNNNNLICHKCGHKVEEHGAINGALICPGSYIIYENNSNKFDILDKGTFEKTYKKVIDENDVIDVS